MIFYVPIPGEEYEGADCVRDEDYDMFRDFDGSPRAEGWQPVPVKRIVTWSRGRLDLPADIPWFTSDVLVMRRRAVEALRDMLEEHGEILPLATEDGVELFAWNVTRVIDALDMERSDVSYFSTGRIMSINAPAFHEPMVRGVDYFKLPLRATCVYLGERFVDRVYAAGLTGLVFRPVWSSETGPIKRKKRARSDQ